ncbi:MAG: hypothetical protein WCJ49_03715 [Deltaproteobacteria bacterium]
MSIKTLVVTWFGGSQGLSGTMSGKEAEAAIYSDAEVAQREHKRNKDDQ